MLCIDDGHGVDIMTVDLGSGNLMPCFLSLTFPRRVQTRCLIQAIFARQYLPFNNTKMNKPGRQQPFSLSLPTQISHFFEMTAQPGSAGPLPIFLEPRMHTPTPIVTSYALLGPQSTEKT